MRNKGSDTKKFATANLHPSYKRTLLKAFPGGSDGKASVYNVRDLGSIPGLGRFPGEGNGSTLALKIPWTEELGAGYYPWGRKELGTTEQFHFHFHYCIIHYILILFYFF